ncbi:MAG TPA: tellurite resistance/C4-dicarboxylate transporter family protein [Longimicrobiales bacterium]
MRARAEERAGLRRRVATRAAELPPASFSMVMATGIVSTTADLLGMRSVAWPLFGINVLAYIILVGLTAMRLMRFRERAAADLRSHSRAPGFLTAVAGTCILGTEFVLLARWPEVAVGLWALGIVLWLGLIYAFFTLMTILPEKPRLDEGMSGAWMLIVVSTQSVAVLGILLAGEPPVPAPAALGFALGLFLLGCMFYILLFSLILYRFLFFPFDPERLAPPYWINMGAVAITTLAGSLLVSRAEAWPFLREVLPFLAGLTLLFWATATWWIPLLLVLGAWRHVRRRIPLRYEAQFWSMVFPLGMYAVATFRLIEALRWPALRPVPVTVGGLALIAWAATSVGFVRRWAGWAATRVPPAA